MKKYLVILLLFLVACSNIDKKEYYYNNAVRLNAVFGKSLKTFDKAYLRLSLWSENNELIDEKIIYDINHKIGSNNTKKLLINFKNYDKTKTHTITVELFADFDNDDIYERYVGVLKDDDKKEYTYEIRG